MAVNGSNFVDYVKIHCAAGHGGAGSVHLHRSRLTAKGGPDGGDGGRGGNVYLRGNDQMWTLLHLPTLTLPAISGQNHLPVGVQIIGAHRADDALIRQSIRLEEMLNKK